MVKRKTEKYKEGDLKKHLVYFRVDRIRELVGE